MKLYHLMGHLRKLKGVVLFLVYEVIIMEVEYEIKDEKLKKLVSPKISIYSTLITTFGLKQNEYSSVFVNTITMDDLFE